MDRYFCTVTQSGDRRTTLVVEALSVEGAKRAAKGEIHGSKGAKVKATKL